MKLCRSKEDLLLEKRLKHLVEISNQGYRAIEELYHNHAERVEFRAFHSEWEPLKVMRGDNIQARREVRLKGKK